MSLAVLSLVGLFAGFCSGLLGIGGGVVMVPSLLFILPLLGFSEEASVHCAVGTSVTCAFFLTLSSAVAHLRMGHFEKHRIPYLALGGVFGAISGAFVSSCVSGVLLKKLFALLLLYFSYRMFSGNGASNSTYRRPWGFPFFILTGILGGFVAGFFGVGGGVVVVPFLSFAGFSPLEAVGMSSSTLPFITLSSSLGHLYEGLRCSYVPKGCLGFIYIPAVLAIVPFGILGAQLGARAAGRLPKMLLRKLFACLLVVVAVKILL